MTTWQRIAAAECVRLIGLLVDAETPHSKALAVLVAQRLCAIADDSAAVAPPPEHEIQQWIRLARALLPPA